MLSRETHLRDCREPNLHERRLSTHRTSRSAAAPCARSHSLATPRTAPLWGCSRLCRLTPSCSRADGRRVLEPSLPTALTRSCRRCCRRRRREAASSGRCRAASHGRAYQTHSADSSGRLGERPMATLLQDSTATSSMVPSDDLERHREWANGTMKSVASNSEQTCSCAKASAPSWRETTSRTMPVST
jgi:hypothetical protein